MRRRHHKNPLLTRIIVVSILFHAMAIPVLAHFGAFKKIQSHFIQTSMVVLPPPTEAPKQAAVKQKVPEKRAAPVAPKGKASVARAGHGSNAHVHVATASGPGGDSSGPTIDPGTLKVGEVPKDPGNGGGTAPAKEEKPVESPTKEPAKVASAPTKVIAPPPPVIKPMPIVTPPPSEGAHEPVFTEAVPLAGKQPQPTIPDELRSDTLDATVVVEVEVDADGKPTNATITQSTGKRDLDRLALETAKQWRFKPATKDGAPIESRVRLHIEFQVS